MSVTKSPVALDLSTMLGYSQVAAVRDASAEKSMERLLNKVGEVPLTKLLNKIGGEVPA